MKYRSSHYLLAFLSFLVTTGLACGALTSTPTAEPAPTIAPPTQAASSDTPTTGNPASTGDLVTFTDQNKYYAIDVPSDWTHTSGTGTNVYWDTFKSPDQLAAVENLAYDDGTPWSGKDSGKAGLYLLNHTYSNTQQEGDIHVTEEKRQPDGSDRLTWYSKSGKYSGISFFEVRGSTTFLMFTVWWDDASKDQYFDTLNKIIESYQVPK